MKAMILSAGLGTRLKPFTDKHPKALAVVNGKSLLQRNIEYLGSFGIKDIIVNVHHFAKQIADVIEKNNGFGSNVVISDETDEVLETGGGLKKASWFFDTGDYFVLMNVDILTDMDIRKMISYHKSKSDSKTIATLAVSDRSTSRYLLFDTAGGLCGWRNTNTGQEKISKTAKEYIQKAFSGIHILNPTILKMITEQGKFSMIDLYLRLAADHNIFSFDHSDSKFIDVGKPESIARAEAMFV